MSEGAGGAGIDSAKIGDGTGRSGDVLLVGATVRSRTGKGCKSICCVLGCAEGEVGVLEGNQTSNTCPASSKSSHPTLKSRLVPLGLLEWYI